MNVNDDRVLFSRWLRNPRRIGAVVPSGVALTRAIVAEVDLARPGAVVELGGGTGAVTRALLAGGVRPADLVVIERDQSLYRLLHERFPDVCVIHGDARKLPGLLAKAGVGPVKMVISGLPLLTMPLKAQMGILSGSFGVMPEDGVFIQFTYGPTSPVPERLVRRMGLTGRVMGRVWLNVPPATIWRFTRALTAQPGKEGHGGGDVHRDRVPAAVAS
jgi:phosphatidylethanolamine/phosphatidyl-N-methylethanolamine N-methyltransferase